MSKTNRQEWFESLKRGDKIWCSTIWGNTYSETFEGWFDFKGAKGKMLLVDCAIDGVSALNKNKFFETKKQAIIFAAPKRIKYLESLKKQNQKQIAAWSKEQEKLKKLIAAK